jgi:uncharacterized protein Yka (UPF0111/DUF47 family)
MVDETYEISFELDEGEHEIDVLERKIVRRFQVVEELQEKGIPFILR